MDQQQPMSLFDDEHMNDIEQGELAEYEAIIERGYQTFIEVGSALLAIKEKQLYRKTHGTWEKYCWDRWGFRAARADNLIDATKTVANLDPQGSILPTNEKQVRPLTVLEPDQQREAWNRAVETAPNGRITGPHVQRIVDEYRKPTEALPPVPAVASLMAVHYSSDTPEHYTPTEIIEAAIACMGAIDLDPCSNSKESPNVPAANHYTQADDGLAQYWRGRVYMNPPYGREIAKWVDKLCREYEAGNVTEAIALVPARTDTDWFDQLIDGHKFHCFVHGRLVFIGNEASAPFPSAVVYLGTEWGRFYHAFRSFGRIVQEVNQEMFGA